MTILVQQRLLDADAACERAEELIDRHKTECEYIASILERAITELECDDFRVLGMPFGGRGVAGAIEALRALLPPTYDSSRDAIELSALAHQAAMREME